MEALNFLAPATINGALYLAPQVAPAAPVDPTAPKSITARGIALARRKLPAIHISQQNLN